MRPSLIIKANQIMNIVVGGVKFAAKDPSIAQIRYDNFQNGLITPCLTYMF